MGCSTSHVERNGSNNSPTYYNFPLRRESLSRSERKRRIFRRESRCVHSDCENLVSVNLKNKLTFDPLIFLRYTVKDIIYKGKFARIWRVVHKATKEELALKVFDSTCHKNLEEELSVLRRINHPNVMMLLEAFELNNKIHMVMELAAGGTLMDHLETRGPFTEFDARNVIKMVVSGLCYLHALGITHRELRADNILYLYPTNDSKILLTNFGLTSTRKPSGNPYMYTVCNCPHYVPPEVVLLRPYTNSVDMWALGVITYLIITGDFPFDSEMDSKIFKLILNTKVDMSYEIWDEFSEECNEFVQLLFEYDPLDRLTSDEAENHPWLRTSSRSSSTVSLCPSEHPPNINTSITGYSSASSDKFSVYALRPIPNPDRDTIVRNRINH